MDSQYSKSHGSHPISGTLLTSRVLTLFPTIRDQKLLLVCSVLSLPQVIFHRYFRGPARHFLFPWSFSTDIFVDLLGTFYSTGYFTPVFRWTLSALALISVIPSRLSPNFPNKIPHTGACFAWPGGVREGRAAFATVSASPRKFFTKNLILQLSSALLRKEPPPDVNYRFPPGSPLEYDSS